jgi:hypothetical protein
VRYKLSRLRGLVEPRGFTLGTVHGRGWNSTARSRRYADTVTTPTPSPRRVVGGALGCIRPGKPVGNARVESFNGKLLDERLDEQYFLDLADARPTTERRHYTRARPRSVPGGRLRGRVRPGRRAPHR